MKHHLKTAQYLADLLENRFHIGPFKFGLDPLLGLIPVLGDIITLFLSLYLVWIGYKMKIPASRINQMIANIILDFVIGTLPVVGDLGDFVYKANSKNFQILRQFADVKIEEGQIINNG